MYSLSPDASVSGRFSPLNLTSRRVVKGGPSATTMGSISELRTTCNQLTSVLRNKKADLEDFMTLERPLAEAKADRAQLDVDLCTQRIREARVAIDAQLVPLGPKLTSELHCLLMRAEESCRGMGVSLGKRQEVVDQEEGLYTGVISTYTPLVASLQQRCTMAESALHTSVAATRTYADLLSHIKGYTMAVMKEHVTWQSKHDVGMNPCQLPSLGELHDPFTLRCDQILEAIKETDESVAAMGAMSGGLVLGDIIGSGTFSASTLMQSGHFARPGSPRGRPSPPAAAHPQDIPPPHVTPMYEVRPHPATDTSQTTATFYAQRLAKNHKTGTIATKRALYGEEALGYVYDSLGDRFIEGQRTAKATGEIRRWVKPQEELALLKILLSTGNADHESFIATIDAQRVEASKLKASIGGTVRASCRDLHKSLEGIKEALRQFSRDDIPLLVAQSTTTLMATFSTAMAEAVAVASHPEVPETQPTPRRSSRFVSKNAAATPATPSTTNTTTGQMHQAASPHTVDAKPISSNTVHTQTDPLPTNTFPAPTRGVGSPNGSSHSLASSPRRGSQHTSFKQQPLDSPKGSKGKDIKSEEVPKGSVASSPKSMAAPAKATRTSSSTFHGKTSPRTTSALGRAGSRVATPNAAAGLPRPIVSNLPSTPFTTPVVRRTPTPVSVSSTVVSPRQSRPTTGKTAPSPSRSSSPSNNNGVAPSHTISTIPTAPIHNTGSVYESDGESLEGVPYPHHPHQPPSLDELFDIYYSARVEYLEQNAGSARARAMDGVVSDPFLDRLLRMLSTTGAVTATSDDGNGRQEATSDGGGAPPLPRQKATGKLHKPGHLTGSSLPLVSASGGTVLRKPWGTSSYKVALPSTTPDDYYGKMGDQSHLLHNVLFTRTVDQSNSAPRILTCPHCCCTSCPDNEACHAVLVDIHHSAQRLPPHRDITDTVDSGDDADTTAASLPTHISPIRRPLYDTSNAEVTCGSPPRSLIASTPTWARQQGEVDRRLQEALDISNRLVNRVASRGGQQGRAVSHTPTPPTDYRDHVANLVSTTPNRTPQLPFRTRNQSVHQTATTPRPVTSQFVLNNPPSWHASSTQ